MNERSGRRPLRALLLAIPLAITAGGCGTFTDNDAVARVGDTELGQDELADLVPAQPDAESEDNSTAIREIISAWITTSVLTEDLAAKGVVVSDTERAEAKTAALDQLPSLANESDALQDLLVEQRAVVSKWVTQPATDEEMEPFRQLYERGIEVSDAACTAHILVDTEEEAGQIIDELGGDVERFADLARERSTDTASGRNGGALPCQDLNNFSQTITPPFVQAALDAEVGEIVGPVQTDFGYHVIVVRPFDDVGDELGQVFARRRFVNVAKASTVYVDPRYGTYDADNIAVIALGAPDTGLVVNPGE